MLKNCYLSLDHDSSLKKRNARHFCMLHFFVFDTGPSSLQSFPPLDGGGLVQVLVNVCDPPPQVALHSEADQSVKPPSVTRKKKREKKHVDSIYTLCTVPQLG